MANQKKRTSRVSSGKTKARNIARHEKKLAKFAEKRANGIAYEYVPLTDIPEKDRAVVRAERAEKTGSKKLPTARWTSLNRKLDNVINKEREAAKKSKELKEKAEV